MEDCYSQVVAAADGPWPVAAIALIGFYLLVWKFGRDILAVVKATHEQTKNVSESIITNHGSKNLGDAVDKITEALERLEARVAELEPKE